MDRLGRIQITPSQAEAQMIAALRERTGLGEAQLFKSLVHWAWWQLESQKHVRLEPKEPPSV